MSKQIVDLAVEIANCRDSELPSKLVKIKDLLKTEPDQAKLKTDIYKFDILEAISVSLKNEFGYLEDGWKLAVSLVKILCQCTSDFELNDKNYQNIFLPTASENILVLAKKLQEKHVKSKAYSDDSLSLFRETMREYVKMNINNPWLALRSLKSQRLFQLFLTDEQNTSAILINNLRDLMTIKQNLISQLGDKALFLILDEIIYKMATSELKEVGEAIFNILITMCNSDPNLIRQIVRRYRGIKILTNKWLNKGVDKEIKEFHKIWDGAVRLKIAYKDLDQKAVIIQKTWRGYLARKKLKNVCKSLAKFQQVYRAKKELNERKRQKKLAQDELKFQLLLDHRRKQRQRNMKMSELLEILPPNQIEKFFEKQREEACVKIQAMFRGYRERKNLKSKRQTLIENKAAICIQRATRRFLDRLNQKRMQPAFYSRPTGLDSGKRELLLDKIRKHLDSLPPHPRNQKELVDLHERSQKEFQNYVINQRSIRQQQQKIQVLLAMTNHDADLLLNCPKLSQVSEEDVSSLYSHKSMPVMLAAKEAHKEMLRKQRAKWYELLSDESDSDAELNDNEKFDDLNNGLKNMNFNIKTDNYYYLEADAKRKLRKTFANLTEQQRVSYGVTKRERNQLKSHYLRKKFPRNTNFDSSNKT